MNSLVPIAETFHSIQGEGMWVGTPMHFIRTPGCPVGVAATSAYIKKRKEEVLPILKSGLTVSMCCSYSGEFFVCDTDWYKYKTLTVSELLDNTYEHHICLTGGEPLIHQNKPWFKELFDECEKKNIQIHVETSGTIALHCKPDWLTVAPKYGYLVSVLSLADEIKLLINDKTRAENLTEEFDPYLANIFVCPINGEDTVNMNNVKICMDILKLHPSWRLSFQAHKMLGLR